MLIPGAMAQTGAGSIQGTLRDTTAAVISRRVPMLIRPAIGDTDPIRYRRPTPDGQFSGNILDEAMRPSNLHAETHQIHRRAVDARDL